MLIQSTLDEASFDWFKSCFRQNACKKIEINFSRHSCAPVDPTRVVLYLLGTSLDSILVGSVPFAAPWSCFADVSYEILDFEIPELRDEWDNSYEVDFMKALVDSKIPYSYTGWCLINDWVKLLSLITSVLANVSGSESPWFYHIGGGFVFYLHRDCGMGLWYEDYNRHIDDIVTRAKELSFEVVFIGGPIK